MNYRLVLLPLAAMTCTAAPPALSNQTTPLVELDLSGVRQGWQTPQRDLSVMGKPLRVGGQAFESGLGMHAPAAWQLPLAGKATEFRARVGVQEYADNPGVGSVEFIVRGDDRVLWRSGVMRGRDAAKEVRVSLAGVTTLTLEVTDGGDGSTSDHADWLDPVLVHNGAPLPVLPEVPPLPDEQGDPANAGASVDYNEQSGQLQLLYDGKTIFIGFVHGKAALGMETTRRNQAVTQTITLTGKDLLLKGAVMAGTEAIAAETRGAAQPAFPLVRTTNGGPSRNLRNNAIYARHRDWLLAGAARIEPKAAAFAFTAAGDIITLTFKPRFYQRHKHITHFRPWTYQVRRDSITGWSSWWAFMRNCSQADCDALLAVWQEKRLADYGYRFIQLDDCFQDELGQGQGRPLYPGAFAGYPSRGPETWLNWRKDLYPAGQAGFVAACRQAGFEPAIWIGSQFTDNELISRHPDWFIRDAKGKPFMAPWASAGVDATNPQALDGLVRPTFSGVRKAGFSYVKIDLLRHYLYDNLHHNAAYCQARGITPDGMFRKFLASARQELGPETFILSCWGVLPESVGIADACRIGGDGYGPVTMQQYNSWNGIVWRNDPDHCDVYPKFKPAETGNVATTTAVTAAPADTIIRPALASIAGCMLMLSDKPAVYRDDANLTGLRRAAPVLFSVPGQLYDFDESKSRQLLTQPRTAITSGGNPTPIDADQFGPVCPWWLNEFDRPFEHWNVLHHLNWSATGADQAVVKFADLGLDPATTYLVYEFWSQKFLGSFQGSVELPAIKPQGLDSFAIREQLDHPQLISTNRHLSQGGVDLSNVEWQENQLLGRSKVVANDRYELVVHLPAGWQATAARIDGKPAEIKTEGEVTRVAFLPPSTGEFAWKISFQRN